jgi:hypothetical protein
MIATKTRVEAFEIVKQKNNRAIENITILSTDNEREPSVKSEEARDDARPHKQCPGKAEINGHRFKTEDTVRILIEKYRLQKCHLSTHIRHDYSLTAPAGSSLCLVRLRRNRSRPIMMHPILATIERQLAI